MSQLKNLYTYLIDNRKHERQAWRTEYEDIVTRVENLRDKLKEEDADLDHPDVYTNDSFENKEELFNRLFANKGNGVASNGQSIFSDADRKQVIDDENFLKVLKNLITEPNKEHHNEFANIWNRKLDKNNPVQTNRVSAACTLEVSSTVDEGKSNQVFKYLNDKKLLPEYKGDHSWYDKNEFAIAHFGEELADVEDIDDYWINIFYWEIYAHLANPFNLKKQLVKYGAPGTGKTYIAKEVAKLQFNIWQEEFTDFELKYEDACKVVQFHPSYSYEDFMEGLRPVLDKENQAQLQLVNGIFKSQCIQAGKWEVDVLKLDLNQEVKKKNWDQLTVKDLEKFKTKLKANGNYWEYIFAADSNKKLSEVIPPYFIIIDEINRAELSRVFGELMYCLEYRGINGAIETQYNQLNTESTGMLKLGENYKFFVPHNLFLIGTMNTVDRSVESFDFALRRRFRWEEVQPDVALLHYHLDSFNKNWLKLSENLKKLNKAILNEPLLGKDFCIGHAYLMNLGYAKETTITDVRKLVWQDSIAPLLEEYVRGTGREAEIMQTFDKAFGL